MSSLNAYFIQCITNLHAGSGDANYGIIDKLVQRDTVFNYPTIHASSLKGALRQHFEDAKYSDIKIDEIFGKKTDSDEDAESGNCNFLSADLVALPVRCSHKQFALTLCPQLVESVNAKSKMLTNHLILNNPASIDKLFTNEIIDPIYLEDDNLNRENYISLLIAASQSLSVFNSQFAYVENKKFDNYSKDLPVIARNRLDENKNLWYEEIVPHQTIFITYILSGSSDFNLFEQHLLNDFIQVGGNSSVGYGLCKFHKIDYSTENDIK